MGFDIPGPLIVFLVKVIVKCTSITSIVPYFSPRLVAMVRNFEGLYLIVKFPTILPPIKMFW
jgi:hypothetical protein